MPIPPFSSHAAFAELRDEILGALGDVLESGRYIGGDAVADFERAFAGFCGAGHCVGVGNGLDALRLALRALGIGPGDEVIVASNGFIATLLAVSAVGATPVLVEPEERSFTIDPERIEPAITSRTRAIVPTHLYGHPCDLDPILALARGHGLKLVEDAAQAQGAAYRGRRLGAHGDIVCWSFYPTKNLGAMGDAGAVTTDDGALAERVRLLGNYGSRERYRFEEQGMNSRLDPLQAAILKAKLPKLDEWNARRRTIAGRYAAGLADGPLSLPAVADWAEPVWHQYVVRSPHRDRLQQGLAERGVETIIHYPVPPHLQPAYRGALPASQPIAERLAGEVLSLPLWPQMGDDDVDQVIAAVRSVAAE